MNIVFFGFGSIGQRHAEILNRKFKHNLFAFRSGKSNLKLPNYVNELWKWNEVKKLSPDIAFITNPTSLHVETAIKCAMLGCRLFIDKPIGESLNGLEKLEKIVKRKKLPTYIGYNLRFHPVILHLKKYFIENEFLHMNVTASSYLPNWRKETDFRKSYRVKKKMGGGVILDLSHEFDYISYLLGGINSIKGNFSRRSNLTIDTEDNADAIIDAKAGPANLHINFFSHKNYRVIQIDFEKLTVIGDLVNSTIEEYKEEKLISRKKFKKDRNLSFENQLEYFFKNIDNPKMMNSLSDAIPLYKRIIKFRRYG